MNTLIFLFEAIRDWTAFAYWQSLLFLGSVVVAERFFRRRPWQAHLMLTLAIFASLLSPCISFGIDRSGGGVISPGSIFALETQSAGIPSLLAPAILVGGILFFLFLLHGIVSARRLMFLAKPFPDRESQEALLEGSRAMQNVSLPVLFTSPSVKSPTVWSWGLHPAVLLPESLSQKLSPEERDGIFLHELAHITRRDHWAALLNRFCGVFLFWNPLYWVALKLADLAADRACDLLVLSREKVSPEIYGETLLRLAAGEKTRPIFQYLSRKELLMKRIDTILDFEENRDRYSVARTALKTLPLTLVVLVLTTALAFCQEKKAVQTEVKTVTPIENKDEPAYVTPQGGFTHRVIFEPATDFAPKVFDELYVVYNAARNESGVKWMFTKIERDKDGRQIFLCLTDNPEKVQAVIDTLPKLKFVKAERLTKESYEKHTAAWKDRMEKPADGAYATPQGGFTHLVVYGPKGDFKPKNPMDYMNRINPKLNEFKVHAGYFRSKPEDGKLIAYNLTTTPENYKKLVESFPEFEYLRTERLTKETFEAYEKTRQESLPSPRIAEIEKSEWFGKLNERQKKYVLWDEKQFAYAYDPENFDTDGARDVFEKRWIKELEKPEPGHPGHQSLSRYDEAILGLATIKSEQAAKLLVNIAAERVVKDNAHRHFAVKALGMLGDPSVVPDLIPLVYHFNFNTRWDAQIALVRLTGQNFGGDAEAWGKWYNDNRDTLKNGLPAFDMEQVDWSCGSANEEIQRYCDPKIQEESDGQFFDPKPNPEAPEIVKMEPENEAKNVDPDSVTELRVTFDRDMNTGGFSWCGGGETFPKTTDKPRWIDKRTCILPVALESGKTYQLSINARSFKNFRSADGVPVEPVPYTFSTKAAF